MNYCQAEEIEDFVHKEEVESRVIMVKWFLGVAAACLLAWAGWVSQQVVSYQSDREAIHRIDASLQSILANNRIDTDTMRKQFTEMDARIDSMPPKDFRDRVDMMQTKLEALDRDLKQNAVEHQQIIGTIGKMEVTQSTIVEMLNEIKARLNSNSTKVQ